MEFVNERLFKELKDLTIDETTDKRALIVKCVFEDSYNYMKSGTLLRQLINKLNEIDFDEYEDRHAFNDIYETILKDLQSAGNAGEYYTPRVLTDFIIEMLNPQIGEQVADFACGTGGFLVSSLKHLKKQVKTIEDRKIVQSSLFGIEKKPLPHLLCMTNLLLHDVDSPNILRDNSLSTNVRDYTEKDKYDVIAMNSPFGGVEEVGIQMALIDEGFRNNHTSEVRLWKDIKRGFTHFAENDVAIAKITPCFENRKSAIMRNLVNEIGAGTTELHIIRSVNELILPEYILNICKTDRFIKEGVATYTGTAGQQRISKDYIMNLTVPLPPLAEQKRIVEKVDIIMDMLDKLEKELIINI